MSTEATESTTPVAPYGVPSDDSKYHYPTDILSTMDPRILHMQAEYTRLISHQRSLQSLIAKQMAFQAMSESWHQMLVLSRSTGIETSRMGLRGRRMLPDYLQARQYSRGKMRENMEQLQATKRILENLEEEIISQRRRIDLCCEMGFKYPVTQEDRERVLKRCEEKIEAARGFDKEMEMWDQETKECEEKKELFEEKSRSYRENGEEEYRAMFLHASGWGSGF